MAGIVMLAVVATALLVMPSAGQSNGLKSTPAETLLSVFTIDGVETMPLSSDPAR
jgi:hypothetical protein